MQIEFLGSGGAITIPRPACGCRICRQAREKGLPYSRSGPSIFIHGPDILIDTPEEIKEQLNRSGIENITACFYSHWHPDHVMGRRVWEMNHDFRGWPPRDKRTEIYLPGQVARDFRNHLGTWEHLSYLEQLNCIHLTELKDGEAVTVGNVTVRPFRLAQDFVYVFIIEQGARRVLIAMDELLHWIPPQDMRLDLAILPMGIPEHHPLTGERLWAEGHPVLQAEATFSQTLDIVRALKAKRVLLMHIEEPDGLGYDDLKQVEAQLRNGGLNIGFTFDMQRVDV